MNDTYVKLNEAVHHGVVNWNHGSVGTVNKAVMELVWPIVVELLAKIGEYEHALFHELEHGMDPNPDDIYCTDCRSLAQSALDGVNRADFREQVNDD